jgi:hypothetical protein
VRVARLTSTAALVVAVVGLALSVFGIATRPPCEEGYVRLIDVELAVPVAFTLLAGGAALAMWRAQRSSRPRVVAAVASVFVVLGLGLGVVDTKAIADRRGDETDYGCWTF